MKKTYHVVNPGRFYMTFVGILILVTATMFFLFGCTTPMGQKQKSFFDELHFHGFYGQRQNRDGSSTDTFSLYGLKGVFNHNNATSDSEFWMVGGTLVKYLNENSTTKLLRLYLQRMEAQDQPKPVTHSRDEEGRPYHE